MSIIHTIREKIARQEYEFTIPHFFEEMANDNLIFADIEMAIAHGRIDVKLEIPLLGGDLGVGKSVIREIFTEISRPRDPPLIPLPRGE